MVISIFKENFRKPSTPPRYGIQELLSKYYITTYLDPERFDSSWAFVIDCQTMRKINDFIFSTMDYQNWRRYFWHLVYAVMKENMDKKSFVWNRIKKPYWNNILWTHKREINLRRCGIVSREKTWKINKSLTWLFFKRQENEYYIKLEFFELSFKKLSLVCKITSKELIQEVHLVRRRKMRSS